MSGVTPASAELARLWNLDPQRIFLNHGSFGACPAAVLAEQTRLRARLERDPVGFMALELEPLLDGARRELGAFLGADPDDLAFLHNTTTAVTAVLRSIDWRGGDEILITSHTYNAVRNAAVEIAGRGGATVTVAQIPFPGTTAENVVESVLAGVTARTRLALVDHVTSPTALVLPIERLVRELTARGVEVFVDGAHAPGMVPLDVERLGAAYYAGNCHKWLCAPKGAAFLWVERSRQKGFEPPVVSHGSNSTRTDRSRFRLELDWLGTDDPTAFLCVPAAIRVLASAVEGGWPAILSRNRALALAGRAILCEALGVAAPCDEELIGSMASVPLPDASGAPSTHPWGWDPLQAALRAEDGIDGLVQKWPVFPKRLVRISAQLYNEPAHYRTLAAALTRRVRVSA